MKILVLNSGAKDTAIAWWLSKSKQISELYVAPGNPQTKKFAINLEEIETNNAEQILRSCRKYSIDFVFIGTEAPLLAGVVNFLNNNGISTFGAPLESFKLETDRIFAKEFAKRCNLDIPEYNVFENIKDLKAYIDKNTNRMYTLKPSGFAFSSSIINSDNFKTLDNYARQMLKSGPVILEEHINGLPVTVTVLIDNSGFLVLPTCSEYTKREHGDSNIVTGGMGAVCPVPIFTDKPFDLSEDLIAPVFKQLKKEKLLYKGVLTLALVVTPSKPYLVDFHLRFNDPAAQTILPLIKNDPIDIINALLSNSLSSVQLITSNKSTVSVVIASENYPQKPKTGLPFKCKSPQIEDTLLADLPHIFLGAVSSTPEGQLITTGGRCATIVGIANNIMDAGNAIYRIIDCIEFPGSWFRKDIGEKFFNSLADSSPA